MNAIEPEIVWQLAKSMPRAIQATRPLQYAKVIEPLQLSAPAAASTGAAAMAALSNPLGIAALLAGGTIGGEVYQNYKRDKAIDEHKKWIAGNKTSNIPAQFVAEGENKPAPQPTPQAQQPTARRVWRQAAQHQQRPQVWTQGGAERGYSRNFAEGDDRGGLEEIIMSMPQAESSNPYAQAAAMGNMEQAIADPTDYNARFYEICRQYGLL